MKEGRWLTPLLRSLGRWRRSGIWIVWISWHAGVSAAGVKHVSCTWYEPISEITTRARRCASQGKKYEKRNTQ